MLAGDISEYLQESKLYGFIFMDKEWGNKYSFPVNRVDFGKVCQEIKPGRGRKMLKLKINIGSLMILSIC